MLAGVNLAYLGLEYKYLRPNLMMGILELHDIPTLGLEHETFVLWMALVETLSGLLIMAGVCADTHQNPPFLAKREIKMGRLAVYNAVAAVQGFKLLRWSKKRPWVYLAALGRYATVGRFFGIRLGGMPAWLISRALWLFTLPGLERNLRILIDWVLDIPFRNDIVVLAPQRTHKLSRAHYEVGDEIVRQGEKGDCAYLLLAGEVEALQRVNGRMERLRACRSGECFGEIALLCDTPRTASIKCLTPVDVVVLPVISL